MGTSKAYKGRPDRNQLLPPEARPQPPPPDSPPDQTHPPENPPDPPPPPQEPPRFPPITFKQARRVVNGIANGMAGGAAGVGGAAAYRTATSSYVRASGGSRIAAQASVAGRLGARQLLGFLSGVAQNGILETAKLFSMGNLANQPPDIILQRVVDALFPTANTREEVLARNSGAKTLEGWLGQFDLANGDITRLDSTDLESVPTLVREYLITYIADRMDNELLEWANKSQDMDTALELSEGMRDYIAGELENILDGFNTGEDSFAWIGEIPQITEKLFEEAFTLIESPSTNQTLDIEADITSESSDIEGDQ